MGAGGYAERPAGTLGTLRLQTTGLLGDIQQVGAVDPAGEAAQVAVEHQLPVAMVCRVLGAPRSTIYAHRVGAAELRARPGPATSISDAELVGLIRRVLADSPFAGEGYRKVRARLAREHEVGVRASGCCGYCAKKAYWPPQRVRGRRKPRPHDGTIIPDRPNLRWGTDATMAWTAATAGCGGSPSSTTTAPRPGRMWPRPRTASPRCGRSTTRSLTAGPARCRRGPRDRAAP
jgi:hypothetical protein